MLKNKKYQSIKNTFNKDIILNLLDIVEKKSDTTQLKISFKLGVAVGLANSYLKRCIKKGWVKVKTVPVRRYAYYLTPKGFAIKSKLTAEYLYSTFKYFRETRDQFEEIIKLCKKKKYKKVLLFGEGDLTEIAILFIKNFNLNFIGSTGLEKNYKSDLKKISYDCVWITDMHNRQTSHDILNKSINKNIIFYPKILGIGKEEEKK